MQFLAILVNKTYFFSPKVSCFSKKVTFKFKGQTHHKVISVYYAYNYIESKMHPFKSHDVSTCVPFTSVFIHVLQKKKTNARQYRYTNRFPIDESILPNIIWTLLIFSYIYNVWNGTNISWYKIIINIYLNFRDNMH